MKKHFEKKMPNTLDELVSYRDEAVGLRAMFTKENAMCSILDTDIEIANALIDNFKN